MLERLETSQALALAVLFLALGVTPAADPAAAQQTTGEVRVTGEVAVRYPHVWRGITLRDFPVLATSATLHFAGGTVLQLWAGLDLGDGDGRQGEVQEIDVDLSHSWTFGTTSMTLGYVGLIFPDGIETTGEAYLKWRSQGRFQPAIQAYYNVDLLEDLFVDASFGESWSRSPHWKVVARANLAWAGAEYAKFFGGSRAGLHHAGLLLSFQRLTRKSELEVRVGFSESLDSRVLPDQSDRLWIGVYLRAHHP